MADAFVSPAMIITIERQIALIISMLVVTTCLSRLSGIKI